MGYIYLHVVVFSGSKALFREFLGALQVIQMALRSIPLAPLGRLQLQSLRGEYLTYNCTAEYSLRNDCSLQSTQRRPQSHLTCRNKAFLATAKRI